MALTRLRASNISDSDYKSSCRVCTATNITLSGGAPNSVDDISLSKFDRILVKAQSTASQNGIYRVATVGTGSNGTWIRDIDATTNNSISAGSIVYVESGTANGGKFFYLTTTGSVVIGTTELSFSDLLGSVATTAISNGNSNVSVAANSNVTVSVAGNSNVLTITGTGANISGTANISGNANVGNLGTAGLITATGNVTGGNLVTGGALSVTGNANVGNLGTSGNITAGNISSIFRPTSGSGTAGIIFPSDPGGGSGDIASIKYYASTGETTVLEIKVANDADDTILLTATGGTKVTGNITAPQLISNVTVGTAPLIVTSTTQVANLNVATAGTAATVTTAAQPNITSVGSLSSLTVTGNANVGNLGTAGLITATGNVSGGNLTTGGVLSVTGNANTGNLGTTTLIATTGNIITVNSGLVQNGNSNITVTANGNVTVNAVGGQRLVITSTGANISGTANVTGNLDAGGNINITGNIIPSANITYNLGSSTNRFNDLFLAGSTIDLGGTTLSAGENGALAVSSILTTGDVTVGGNLTVNGTTTTINSTTLAVDDLNIVLASGAANALAANGGGITIDGANATLNYISASNTWTFDRGITVNGIANITGNSNVGNLSTAGLVSATGNIDGGNLNTIGLVSATGNITGGNLVTGGVLSVTGNANVGNLGTSGLVVATGNVSGGNLATAGVLSVTGNANVGNLGTGGLIVATGNITGGNLTTSGVLSVTGNANVGNLGTSGNITAGFFLGNGSQLTGIATNSIFNGNSNVSVAANANVTVSVAGNSNIITVTGTGANITGTANVTGNANVGNLGTATAIITTGNITTINSGLVQNGNSNVTITTNGNVTINAVGGERFRLTSTGANITGTANISGDANVGNLGTSGNITASGNISGLELISTNASGDEGGEIKLTKPPNGTLGGGVTIDAYQNRLRIFEQGGSARGAYIDLSACAGSAGTNLLAGGGGAFTTSASAPASADVGDFWYETDTDILYIYINDGESNFWLDIVTFPSELANGNSNIMINANSNITVSAAGNSNVFTVTGTGANITGTANITGNSNLSNLTTSGRIVVAYDGTADAGTVNNSAMIEIQDTGATATPSISFHRPAAFATKITLNTDNFLYFGGWSAAQGGQTLVAGNILPGANTTYSLGSTTLRYANVFGVSSSALYADLAEKYWADDNYSAGTVVIFGGTQEITTTSISHDTRVAGVISTNPAYLMNDTNLEGIWLPVALTGRVPTQVRGPINKGDLVVASQQPGIAMKIDQHLYNPGCIIGKSLEVIDDDSINIIEVVIGRF
jgi:hypothetical protein